MMFAYSLGMRKTCPLIAAPNRSSGGRFAALRKIRGPNRFEAIAPGQRLCVSGIRHCRWRWCGGDQTLDVVQLEDGWVELAEHRDVIFAIASSR